jgi:hypothetical protein
MLVASGDLRNVVKTVGQIASSYEHSVNITINDRDLDIVARNAILLLIALAVEDTEQAINCMIHVWYSTLIRKADLDILQQRVRPLIQDICDKIKNKELNTLLGKSWTFGERSVSLVLEKSSWDGLLLYLDVPRGLTAERAKQVRASITLAEPRRDYRDRHLLFQTPSHRIAFNRFRTDGLLLPFGAQRDDFQEPNP